MDRRNRTRHNLQLICLTGHICPLEGVTENIGRDGILVRWPQPGPLPRIGSSLALDVQLPASPEFAPRVMHCSTTVVRIGGLRSLGLRIDGVQFKRALKMRKRDLERLAPLTDRIN